MRAGIIGAGGHGLDVMEIMRTARWEFAGWFDDDPTKGYPSARYAAETGCPVVIGVNDPQTRTRIAVSHRYTVAPPLYHHAAEVGANCFVASGAVLAAFTVLTVGVTLGPHTHLNVGASVSQSSTLGAFCTVGPGARICGDVIIGDRVLIGAGAVIANTAVVRDDAIVGAGAVVLPGQQVEAGATVVGVPAKARA